MTVGIGAFGQRAGAAILAAWAEAERLASGEIGGFAVFAAIPSGAGPVSLECQRGGFAAILAEWGDTGLLDLMAAAPLAALITSGPDRLAPLSQYLAAGRAGLVTGHRLPNLAGADGVALNAAALRLLESGVAPEEAVERVTQANPDVDAGLIAVSHDAVALAETALVRQRRDRGQALLRAEGAALAVLHNSVRPVSVRPVSVRPVSVRPVAGLAERVASAGMTAFS